MAHSYAAQPTESISSVTASLFAALPETSARPSEGALFQDIFAAMPAALVVLDAQGIVCHINPQAERLLGAHLVGTQWRDQIQTLFDTSYRGSALKLRSGRLVSLITHPLGATAGQLVMLQDVTEVELLQQRLNQSQRLGELGRMAANLAHQIRTPLATALLYATQLDSPELDTERRSRFARKNVDALRGLEDLISQMLLFVRGERGEMANFSTTQLIEELLAEVQQQSQCSSTSWRLCDTTLGSELYSSRSLLKSALTNLMMNAAEAQSAYGAGEITLTLNRIEGRLQIVIEDQAGGIDSEQQKRLFQIHPSQKSRGTGLGLAVVKRIIDELGGEISFSSLSGIGSRFEISLPNQRAS